MKSFPTYSYTTSRSLAYSILLLVLFSLGNQLPALSQNQLVPKVGQAKVDSLLNLLQQHQKLDSFRVDLQNQLGYEYWIIDPNQSEIYGTQAIELSRILNYTQAWAFANRVVGVAHWARSNFDLAFRFLFVAHDTYLDLQDSLGIANTLLNLGMVYQDQSNYPPAIENYQKALDLFESLGANSRMATTFSKWAGLLVEQGQYDAAYDLLSKALNTHIKNNFQYGIAEVNNKLGDLFIRKKDYQSALSYLLQSVEAGAKRPII